MKNGNMMAAAASVLGLAASADVEPKPKAKAKPKVKVKVKVAAKVYSDPTYVRTTRKTRRMSARVHGAGFAKEPEVPTRQMRRREAIEADKMPLEMTQPVWHKIKNFGGKSDER